MSQRRPSPSRRGHRVLIASGLTAAMVTVPAGIAAAAPEADPVEQVTTFLEGLAAQADETPAADEAPALPGLPAFTVPAEIRAAFQQLADAAGLPENCVDGVADAIELIVNGLIALPLELAGALADLLALLGEGGVPLPAELQDLLDQILGGLSGGLPGAETPDEAAAVQAAPAPEGASSAALVPAPGGETPGLPGGETPELPTLIEGLVALGEALAACIPAPPTEEPEPEPEPENPPVAQPTHEQPAPPAAQPVAQPVSYPGYAPTGADTARADDVSVPLTALGGGLVLVAAGAVGYGMRGRAVRTRD